MCDVCAGKIGAGGSGEERPVIRHKGVNIFMVFQGKEYMHEFEGGYIYADRATNNAHWNRLTQVKKGDVIFHVVGQNIIAISEAKGKYTVEKRPVWHYNEGNRGRIAEGYMVPLEYQRLTYPLATSCYRNEIIRMQGDAQGKGYPFNKNGTGNGTGLIP